MSSSDVVYPETSVSSSRVCGDVDNDAPNEGRRVEVVTSSLAFWQLALVWWMAARQALDPQ
jgi:hypothetical protein